MGLESVPPIRIEMPLPFLGSDTEKRRSALFSTLVSDSDSWVSEILDLWSCELPKGIAGLMKPEPETNASSDLSVDSTRIISLCEVGLK